MNAVSQLKKLHREQFNYHEDAKEAALKLSKQVKYHNLGNIHIDTC
ncbi:MAG: hypothetical protein AAF630_07320 [Cyanobacteria bacterium P01_C01_bin.38]